MSWDDPPNKANKLPGGQQDQGHEVVLQDQGEGYCLLGIGMAQYLRIPFLGRDLIDPQSSHL